MQNNFQCPVCNETNWEITDTFTRSKPNLFRLRLQRSEMLLKHFIYRLLLPVTKRHYEASQRYVNSNKVALLRGQVLHSWFPDEGGEIKVNTLFCQECDFVCYQPRPELAEIESAFEFMADNYPFAYFANQEMTVEGDTLRAGDIYRRLENHFGSRKFSVLDVGGGDGRILKYFLGEGHSCHMVDYWSPLPGIEKLGDTLKDLSADRTFDLIMINHVIEHLVDPAQTIRQLSRHVSNGGLIYAEVPKQVLEKKTSRAGFTPTVHVNFFTLNSFGRLFQNQGLEVIDSSEIDERYGKDEVRAIYLIARRLNAEA